MAPHARNLDSLPPTGGLSLLGAALRRHLMMAPHARNLDSLPPTGGLSLLGAALRRHRS